jgi:hypothetical protein
MELRARAPLSRGLPHEACLGSPRYCRIVCGCGVGLGAGPSGCTTTFAAARRCSRRGCAGYASSGCATSAPGATRSEQARLAVEGSRTQRIEPPGAEPHLKRKSARLRTVGHSGAYLCAATSMVPAAVAVSLAVSADAVVPATPVVAASPRPSADRRFSTSFGPPRRSPIKDTGSTPPMCPVPEMDKRLDGRCGSGAVVRSQWHEWPLPAKTEPRRPARRSATVSGAAERRSGSAGRPGTERRLAQPAPARPAARTLGAPSYRLAHQNRVELADVDTVHFRQGLELPTDPAAPRALHSEAGAEQEGGFSKQDWARHRAPRPG